MTTDRDDGGAPPSTKWLVRAMLLLAVPLVVVWWPGCRQYPAVTSKDALGLMKLLYAACNTRDPARLAKVEQGAEKLAREGKLSPPERDSFADIIGMAKGGDWERAEQSAFRFAQDQVGVGHPDAHDHDHPPPKAGRKN